MNITRTTPAPYEYTTYFLPNFTDEHAAHIRQWIDTLRSPDTGPQTQGRLRDDAGMCCLGVACNIYAPSAWKEHMGEYAFLDNYGTPPKAVDNWYVPAGYTLDQIPHLMRVTIRREEFDHVYITRPFSVLNDVHNFTFPMIADVAETCLNWIMEDKNHANTP